MHKKYLVFILKLLLAAGLFSYYLYKGELGLNDLWEKLQEPDHWWVSFILLSLSFFFSAYRWKVILEAKFKVEVSIKNALSIYWIGLFFNNFLPGKLGELSVVYYSKQLSDKFKVPVLMYALLLDNILGLFSLLLIVFMCLSFSFVEFQNIVVTEQLGVPILVLLSLSLAFCLFFIFSRHFLLFIKGLVSSIPKLTEFIKQFIEHDLNHRDKLNLVGKGLTLGLASQLCKSFAFYLLFVHLLPENSLVYFSLIPFGLILTNLVSNTGIGVGNAVFSFIYASVGIDNGAGFFNYYIILIFVLSLTGVIPFLFNRRQAERMR